MTMRARTGLLVCFVFIAAAGCATQNWVAGPDARGTVQEASAQCSIFARHSDQGSFEASGSPKFVAGAAAGYAVGRIIESNADYNDCMAASGWLPADNASGPSSNSPAAQLPSAPTPVVADDQAPDLMPFPVATCTDDDRKLAELARKGGFQYHGPC